MAWMLQKIGHPELFLKIVGPTKEEWVTEENATVFETAEEMDHYYNIPHIWPMVEPVELEEEPDYAPNIENIQADAEDFGAKYPPTEPSPEEEARRDKVPSAPVPRSKKPRRTILQAIEAVINKPEPTQPARSNTSTRIGEQLRAALNSNMGEGEGMAIIGGRVVRFYIVNWNLEVTPRSMTTVRLEAVLNE